MGEEGLGTPNVKRSALTATDRVPLRSRGGLQKGLAASEQKTVVRQLRDHRAVPADQPLA
jgi:hypothetical protein